GRSDAEIASTLVHEMVHVWQQQHGKPPSRGYHDKEWSAKMKTIGLQPSSSGTVGGKETGQRMSHYIVPDGPFAKASATLAASGWRLNLQSAPMSGPNKGPSSKTRFTCRAAALMPGASRTLKLTVGRAALRWSPRRNRQSFIARYSRPNAL